MTNTKFTSVLVSLCALISTGFSTITQAEAQFGVGGGYNFKRDSAMIEGRFAAPVNPRLQLVPQLALDFKIDKLVLDFDGHYYLDPGAALYLLSGLNYVVAI